jgi:predicted Zn finger-like uncharacterized protein
MDTTSFIYYSNFSCCTRHPNFISVAKQLPKARKLRTVKSNQLVQLSCVLKSNPFFQKLSLMKTLEDSLEKMWRNSKASSEKRSMEYIQCSACKAVYPVQANMFGEKGRYVRCIVCGKMWLQLPENIKVLEEDMETKELSQEDWERWKLVRMKNMSSLNFQVDSKE